MIIKPKTRGFICTTAHPIGCAQNVRDQIAYVKSKPAVSGAKRALIIGCSTGFGLASRIAAAFGCSASTIGIAFEKPADGKRTASAGWYNCAAFADQAKADGLYSKTIIGDAFSQEIKQQTMDLIRRELGTIDLLIYSVAAPRRTTNNQTYSSVLKPIGSPFLSKTINLTNNTIADVNLEPATAQEVDDTIKVMGGEDWQLWMDALAENNLLAEHFCTVAYSYIGPAMTHPIYLNGAIGMAKRDLKATADRITEQLSSIGGKAYVSVNKALVTQASSAIPVVPLYISILFKVMKEAGIHEGCIEQMQRLFAERLYAPRVLVDEENRIRIDDLEMRADIQQKVASIWNTIDNQSLGAYTDLNGYWSDFFRLFGFGLDTVNYENEVDPVVAISDLVCE